MAWASFTRPARPTWVVWLRSRWSWPVPTLAPVSLGRGSRRKAQAVASLNHPGIVQIHDVGQAGSSPPLVPRIHRRRQQRSRWTVGLKEHHASRLDRSTPSPATPSTPHTSRVSSTATLKPANIPSLTADGRPKITDFPAWLDALGDASDLTLPGTIVGTPDFMAPEQTFGQVHDAGPLDRTSTPWAPHHPMNCSRADRPSRERRPPTRSSRSEPRSLYRPGGSGQKSRAILRRSA